MSESTDLTGEQMLAVRSAALTAACTSHSGLSLPEIAHAAGCYLEFLLNGQPITLIGQTVRVTQGVPPSAAPAPAVGASAPTPQPAAVRPAEPPPAAVRPAKPPKAAATTAPVTQAPPAAPLAVASSVIPPPTTILEAAEALKALVVDKATGRGRAAALALLKEFDVAQLSQVPPARLAEFKSRCESAGAQAAPAADPTGGLLG